MIAVRPPVPTAQIPVRWKALVVELSLEPFDEAYAQAVLDWVRSPAELEEWASVTYSEPSPALFQQWHADPEVHPFLLFAEGRFYGYGEVWEDRAEAEAELARILVAPGERGRGIGRRLVGLLVQRALDRGFDEIWLRVVPTNAPALACYRRAGFVRAGTEEEARFNEGQPRPYVWMRLPQGT
jgi:ribosomal-protein-alanine N-acetyltransferase